MLKITSARPNNIKSLIAGLTLLTTLTASNIDAVGAQISKVLTPSETEQRRAAHLRYQQYVVAQYAKIQERQAQLNEKIQLELKKQADQNASATNPPGTGPKRVPKISTNRAPIKREDILLVMPNKDAKTDDVIESIEGAQGEICGSLGGGDLEVILVKARPGKIIQLQRLLAADKRDFKHVDYNRKASANFIPTTEPTFSKAWHLSRMNIPDAWDELYKYNEFPNAVAVLDSGAMGKACFICDQGADCRAFYANFPGFPAANAFKTHSVEEQEKNIVSLGKNIMDTTKAGRDVYGHGTWMSCIISNSPYDSRGAAGVNPKVPIFPVKILDNQGQTDELAAVAAMCVLYSQGDNFRIINLSCGPMMDANVCPILHEFFKDWHDRKNGLIFESAGNEGENLSMTNQPYLNVVTAMANKDGMQLAKTPYWQSASGTAVDFTAPGENIQVCDQMGDPTESGGTSSACPLVAGVASLIWCINGKLKNTDVEKILRDSCVNTNGPNTWNPQFGWGMPDAYKAVKEAETFKGQ